MTKRITINLLNDYRHSTPWWERYKSRITHWFETVQPPRIEAVLTGVAIAVSIFCFAGTLLLAPVPVCAGVAIALSSNRCWREPRSGLIVQGD